MSFLPDRHEKDAWFCLILTAVALGAFIQKPFHIDDTLFLTMADLMPWTFLGNAGGEAYFLGQHYPHLNPFESTHPLLIPWFLKLLDGLQLGKEPAFWIFHLGFLVFPLLLVGFTLQVLRYLGKDSRWSLFLILSPVLFVNSTNLMTDAAMVAFWVGTLAGCVVFVETDGHRGKLQAGLCFLAALLTSYQSMALFPLVIAYLLIARSLKRRAWILFAIPTLGFLSYLVLVYAFTGFFPLFSSSIDINITSEVASGFSWGMLGHKTLATLVFLGLGLLFVVPAQLGFTAAPGSLALRLMVFFGWMALIMSVGFTADLLPAYSVGEKMLVFTLAGFGSYALVWVLAEMVLALRNLHQNPKNLGVVFMAGFLVLGVVFYNIVLMPYGTARYVLPAGPGVVLLLALRARPLAKSMGMGALGIMALLTCLLMAAVDFRQAQADWFIFQSVRQKAAPNQMVRFSDDAGLVRYFKKGYGKYIDQTAREIGADELLLVTRGMIHQDVLDQTRQMETFEIPSFWGLSLFNTEHKAGFYRSLDGLLPLAFAPTVRKAYLLRVTWFENNFDQAEKWVLPNENYFRKAAAEFPDRSTQHGLLMHPDAKIAYPWPFQKAKVVRGKAAPVPSSWDKEGDGVTCTIGYRSGDSETVLWTQEINFKGGNLFEEQTFTVTIPAEADALWFQVGPGSQGDYRYDSMLWYDLAIEPAPQTFKTPARP